MRTPLSQPKERSQQPEARRGTSIAPLGFLVALLCARTSDNLLKATPLFFRNQDMGKGFAYSITLASLLLLSSLSSMGQPVFPVASTNVTRAVPAYRFQLPSFTPDNFVLWTWEAPTNCPVAMYAFYMTTNLSVPRTLMAITKPDHRFWIVSKDKYPVQFPAVAAISPQGMRGPICTGL